MLKNTRNREDARARREQMHPLSFTANSEKWTSGVMAMGWVAVPQLLFNHQNAIGIDPIDLNILMQLVAHWSSDRTRPFPSVGRLAALMSVNTRTIQRHVEKLESQGLIRRGERFRANRQKSNTYDLSGLVQKLVEFADSERPRRYPDLADGAQVTGEHLNDDNPDESAQVVTGMQSGEIEEET